MPKVSQGGSDVQPSITRTLPVLPVRLRQELERLTAFQEFIDFFSGLETQPAGLEPILPSPVRAHCISGLGKKGSLTTISQISQIHSFSSFLEVS